MNLETTAITTLTEGYDDFRSGLRAAIWSCSRAGQGYYEIYTIKPDGTGVNGFTFSQATTRSACRRMVSTSGGPISPSSSGRGHLHRCPQPYGRAFVMRYDGANVQHSPTIWEDGPVPGSRRWRRLLRVMEHRSIESAAALTV